MLKDTSFLSETFSSRSLSPAPVDPLWALSSQSPHLAALASQGSEAPGEERAHHLQGSSTPALFP